MDKITVSSCVGCVAVIFLLASRLCAADTVVLAPESMQLQTSSAISIQVGLNIIACPHRDPLTRQCSDYFAMSPATLSALYRNIRELDHALEPAQQTVKQIRDRGAVAGSDVKQTNTDIQTVLEQQISVSLIKFHSDDLLKAGVQVPMVFQIAPIVIDDPKS